MREGGVSVGSATATGRRGLRSSTVLSMALAGVLGALLVAVAYRFELAWEAPVSRLRLVSERTRDVLADTQGSIRIICFMDRNHPVFRPLSRLLRGLRQASRSVAGAELVVEYVDPRWDVARAGQLVGWGVPENALVFEQRPRRRVVVTLDEMLAQPSQTRLGELPEGRASGSGLGVFRGEAVCAAALAKLGRPQEATAVYWLLGHGEARHDDYDELRGFSDIAREMRRDGYEIRPLSLPGRPQVPPDCQILAVVGARYPLAGEEVALIEAYLAGGGRLLVLLTPQVTTGLEPLLARWGIRVTPFVAVSPRTLSGLETVVSRFAEHVVTRDLRNASVVFGQAACLEVADLTERPGEAHRPEVTLLASTDEDGWGEAEPSALPRHFDPLREPKGPVAVAAVAERGGRVSKEVAYRPGRVCVVGEADFVMNGTLAVRASANRDFLMNALGWLAGIDAGSSPSVGGDATLVTGFTRREWLLFMAGAAGVVPGVFLALFLLFAWRTRR